MNQYTITTRCHLTDREVEYIVAFPSKSAVARYFKYKPDELIGIKNGWGDFSIWCHERWGLRLTRPDKPAWERKRDWSEPKAYDYRTDMSDIQF